MSAEILSFETGRPAELADDEPALVVDVEGYEGPLDLLLALARQQKVDLAKISILALADQYLRVHRGGAEDPARACRRLSGDGGMAGVPEIAPAAAGSRRRADGPSAEEMATALANRLRRLEAIREASNRLMNRPQLQRDIFPRGNPEAIAEIRHPRFTATLFDLLTAYAAQRQQRVLATRASGQAHGVVVDARREPRWSGWSAWPRTGAVSTNICSTTSSIPRRRRPCSPRASPPRSNWSAKARLELNQKEAFAPLYFRKRPPQPVPTRCRAGPAGRVSGRRRPKPWQAWRKNA